MPYTLLDTFMRWIEDARIYGPRKHTNPSVAYYQCHADSVASYLSPKFIQREMNEFGSHQSLMRSIFIIHTEVKAVDYFVCVFCFYAEIQFVFRSHLYLIRVKMKRFFFVICLDKVKHASYCHSFDSRNQSKYFAYWIGNIKHHPK